MLDQQFPYSTDAARIGPNAVIQLGEALRAGGHGTLGRALFAEARCPDWFDNPPEEMVSENRVAVLHRTLYRMLPPAFAREIAGDAGRRTGNYILANRIPAAARLVLKALPARASSRLLLEAISAHAWTFAGSGVFAHSGQYPAMILISQNPLAVSPRCDWHMAVFQVLFRALVHPDCAVREVECCGRGHPACRFEISWRHTQPVGNGLSLACQSGAGAP